MHIKIKQGVEFFYVGEEKVYERTIFNTDIENSLLIRTVSILIGRFNKHSLTNVFCTAYKMLGEFHRRSIFFQKTCFI